MDDLLEILGASPGSGVHYFHPIPLARIQVHGHMVLPNCRGCWDVKCVPSRKGNLVS